MIMSESTTNIFPALIKARTDIQAVQRDKDGFGYKYATLDNVLNMLKDVLPMYDLGFVQFPETIDGKDGVTTVVIHKSGEYISARYEMDATPVKGTNLTQQKGASITYTRRYSLCSVFGIATEEDTDGVVAGQPQTKTGMDTSQITGTASSYARKYALTKDADTDEYHKQTTKTVVKSVTEYMGDIDNAETKQEINNLFYEWSKIYVKGTDDYKKLTTASFERKKQIVGA